MILHHISLQVTLLHTNSITHEMYIFTVFFWGTAIDNW